MAVGSRSHFSPPETDAIDSASKNMPISLSGLRMLELPSLKMPFWRYFEIFRDRSYAFLLDSALESARQGRYSFCGGDPFLVFRAKRTKVDGKSTIPSADCTMLDFRNSCGDRPKITTERADPFAILRKLFEDYRLDFDDPAQESTPAPPFLGGAVGYFGYESGHFFEDLPNRAKDDLKLPDIYLMFYHRVLVHCHDTGKSFLAVRAASDAEIEQENETVVRQMREFESSLVSNSPNRHSLPRAEQQSEVNREKVEIHSHFDETSYSEAVQWVKEHIAAGDVYQVCLTHRLESILAGGSAWDLYRALRRINPAPFASFLKFPEVEVVSSSPERFLKLDSLGTAESRPIKGTRPRGKTPTADERLRNELQNSPKDRAENVMIVDLVRNDFGRVCEYRSVQVPDFLGIESYATVFQMVSTVVGRLTKGCDRFDLIRACFPGGSMTGAPKIEAMKIIDRLEPVERGIYSGGIGYLDFRGAMDLSMVIRTILIKDGRCFFHVGGGIVADSDPKAEYRETQDKAHALIAAMESLRTLESASK
jgi:aminodeoxychorismate synthase component I